MTVTYRIDEIELGPRVALNLFFENTPQASLSRAAIGLRCVAAASRRVRSAA